ncbi:uncharacterized protein LOC144447378 isoform X2 [Glandiceps talaboti]
MSSSRIAGSRERSRSRERSPIHDQSSTSSYLKRKRSSSISSYSRSRSRSPGSGLASSYTNSNLKQDIDSRVFIGNLATELISRSELHDLFSKHGEVRGVSLHKGFAFVQFNIKSDAEAAVKEFAGTLLKGKRVDCNLAGERKKGDPPNRGNMDRERERDRGSRESSRLRDYDRFDAYERGYDRDGRRSPRDRSPVHVPVRGDPYDDRYRREEPPLRRAERFVDDPYDRRDPYPRRERVPDDYYRERRDERYRDERDDPYRRDSYELRERERERDRDRERLGERERERDPYARPFRDYPEPAEPLPPPPVAAAAPPASAVQRPIDCEIIVVNTQQREYAEVVERHLKQLGLIVDATYLGADISLAQALDDVSRRGVLYAIIITSQHSMHRSVTLNILHGTPQEHRNMPLDDAMGLIARNFERYMQNLREKSSASTLAMTQVELTIPQLLCLLADGKQLTADELSRAIVYLQDRHKKLLENQADGAPSAAPAAATAVVAGETKVVGQQQQAALQAKILSIFNPSGSSAAAVSLANTTTTSLAPSVSAAYGTPAAQQIAQPATSLPSLMSQSMAQGSGLAQKPVMMPTSVSNNTNAVSHAGVAGGARPTAAGGDQGSVQGVGINFDNPSVQKALDNLIQSGPNLLKNLGQVGQFVQGVQGMSGSGGPQSVGGKSLLGAGPGTAGNNDMGRQQSLGHRELGPPRVINMGEGGMGGGMVPRGPPPGPPPRGAYRGRTARY